MQVLAFIVFYMASRRISENGTEASAELECSKRFCACTSVSHFFCRGWCRFFALYQEQGCSLQRLDYALTVSSLRKSLCRRAIRFSEFARLHGRQFFRLVSYVSLLYSESYLLYSITNSNTSRWLRSCHIDRRALLEISIPRKTRSLCQQTDMTLLQHKTMLTALEYEANT